MELRHKGVHTQHIHTHTHLHHVDRDTMGGWSCRPRRGMDTCNASVMFRPDIKAKRLCTVPLCNRVQGDSRRKDIFFEGPDLGGVRFALHNRLRAGEPWPLLHTLKHQDLQGITVRQWHTSRPWGMPPAMISVFENLKRSEQHHRRSTFDQATTGISFCRGQLGWTRCCTAYVPKAVCSCTCDAKLDTQIEGGPPNNREPPKLIELCFRPTGEGGDYWVRNAFVVMSTCFRKKMPGSRDNGFTTAIPLDAASYEVRSLALRN